MDSWYNRLTSQSPKVCYIDNALYNAEITSDKDYPIRTYTNFFLWIRFGEFLEPALATQAVLGEIAILTTPYLLIYSYIYLFIYVFIHWHSFRNPFHSR